MTPDDLTDAEQRVWDAFPKGEQIDLGDGRHRQVKAAVIRSLLLGACPVAPGFQAGLMLTGAHISGQLELAYARIECPVVLHECEFTEQIDLYGARLGHISLRGSHLNGLFASHSIIEGTLSLQECRCTGTVYLTGATVEQLSRPVD
jgi:hypothetical protein